MKAILIALFALNTASASAQTPQVIGGTLQSDYQSLKIECIEFADDDSCAKYQVSDERRAFATFHSVNFKKLARASRQQFNRSLNSDASNVLFIGGEVCDGMAGSFMGESYGQAGAAIACSFGMLIVDIVKAPAVLAFFGGKKLITALPAKKFTHLLNFMMSPSKKGKVRKTSDANIEAMRQVFAEVKNFEEKK